MSESIAAARIVFKSLSDLDWGLFLGGLVVLSASFLVYEAVCLARRRSCFVIRNSLLFLALIWWLYVVYALTLSGRFDHGTGVYLMPFTDWFDAEGLRGTKVAFSFLNVLLFVPMGFIFSLLLFGRHRILLALVVCVAASVGIESLQYVLQVGDVETEDVLFNALGSFLGSWLAIPLFALSRNSRTSGASSEKTDRRHRGHT